MALIQEPGSSPIAQYTTPFRGTWNSAAVHAIPEDALYDSLNVFIRKGKLRQRPGLDLYTTTIFPSRVIGGDLAVTPDEERLVVYTKDECYEKGEADSTFNLTDTKTFADSDSSIIDVVFTQVVSGYFGLVANVGYKLKAWNSLTHLTDEIVPSLGTTPFAKSVCISARRVVTLVHPHTLIWSKTNTIDQFDPLGFARISQTNDVGICVKSISNLSFVAYKERSIYPARAQAGNEDTAFSFGEPIRVEGPAGIKAVVDVGGQHCYMTRNGRIALFDGIRYPQWISDGLWLFLQQDIDPTYASSITGVFDYRLHTLTFYYPRMGGEGQLTGMVIINFPYAGDPSNQIAFPICFKGESGIPISHACEVRFSNIIDRSLLFSSTNLDCQSFISNEETNDDDGVNFNCSFQLPMKGTERGMIADVSIETMVERGFDYGSLKVQPVIGNGLESEDGIIPDMVEKYVDLTGNPLNDRILAFNTPCRFFGLKYSWRSDSKVRYSGAIVYSRGIV